MKNKTLLGCVAAVLILACAIVWMRTNTHAFSKDNTVIIFPKGKNALCKALRLEILDEDIIRVSASPRHVFDRTPSLMAVEPEENDIPYDFSREDGEYIISTAKLTAKVDKETGLVAFYDREGRQLLCESDRDYSPIKVENDHGWSVRQMWKNSADESLYGLGQHQSDEWDWAVRNEKLIQYNTKVSIPVLVSTNNYGIFWDNNSMSRFGDERDYEQLDEVFILRDKDGVEGALSGTYTGRDGKQVVRRESILYLEHAQSLEKNLIKNFPLKGTKVVYEGSIEPLETGKHYFSLYYSGYITVYLDGKEIVPERWRTAWNPNTYKFEAELTNGTPADLRIEWRPDGDVAYCGLRALSPLPEHSEPHIAFWSELAGQIDYYFIKGESLDDVVAGMREITGRAPVMPQWTMGYWQCRERYQSSKDYYDVLAHFEQDNLPIDMIIQDWQYWEEDQWGSHEFDLKRYPDPKAAIDSVHAAGVKYMISVWPKFYLGTKHYDELNSNGWIYQQAIRDSIRDWVGPGYVGSFYDAYSESAQKMFWRQMNEHLFCLGVDAWWMDASEPNIRDCVDMPYWKALCTPTALGSSTKYLNTYGLVNAHAIYTGQRGENPDRRVLLLTRSATAGVQRYSTSVWSGDIASRWEDMKAQIPAALNFSIAGVPWWSMDTGGFCVEDRFVAAYQKYLATSQESEDLNEWRELQTRWYQFGAFVPFFRSHGQWPPREYYNIAPEGHPARNSMAKYSRLRSTLLPYIYSLAGSVWKDHYTIMRPLVMDYPQDKAVRAVSDQYSFGPSLMVCPVYQYKAREREVYLPDTKGGWYNLDSYEHFEGGRSIIAKADYETIPVYIPAGAVIPTCAPIRHSMDQDKTKLEILVAEGADGRFSIYEDEGDNYDYEKGEYACIDLIWNDASKELTIGATEGTYTGCPTQRSVSITLIGKDSKTRSLQADYRGGKTVVKF